MSFCLFLSLEKWTAQQKERIERNEESKNWTLYLLLEANAIPKALRHPRMYLYGLVLTNIQNKIGIVMKKCVASAATTVSKYWNSATSCPRGSGTLTTTCAIINVMPTGVILKVTYRKVHCGQLSENSIFLPFRSVLNAFQTNNLLQELFNKLHQYVKQYFEDVE